MDYCRRFQDEGRQLAVAFIYLSDRLVDSVEIEERMKVALARITEKVLADVAVQKAGENATSVEKTGSAGAVMKKLLSYLLLLPIYFYQKCISPLTSLHVVSLLPVRNMPLKR